MWRCCSTTVCGSSGSAGLSARSHSNSAMGKCNGRCCGPGPAWMSSFSWSTTGRTQLLSKSRLRCWSIISPALNGTAGLSARSHSNSAIGRNRCSGGMRCVSATEQSRCATILPRVTAPATGSPLLATVLLANAGVLEPPEASLSAAICSAIKRAKASDQSCVTPPRVLELLRLKSPACDK